VIIGYASGVFDLFHIGHVRLLKNAKSMCDRLIVGVSSDELVVYKKKKPVIPFDERIQVVRACRYVDAAVPQNNLDKVDAYLRYKFDLLFVGDDWYESNEWKQYEARLSKSNVKVIFFPYTLTTSSTLINETLNTLRQTTN